MRSQKDISQDTMLYVAIFPNTSVEMQFTYYIITLLECAIQCFLVYLQGCATITTVNFRTFSSHQKETLCPLAITPVLSKPFSPWQLLLYFLSLRISLFWTSYINGITQYMYDLLGWFSHLAYCFQGSSTVYNTSQYFIPFYD